MITSTATSANESYLHLAHGNGFSNSLFFAVVFCSVRFFPRSFWVYFWFFLDHSHLFIFLFSSKRTREIKALVYLCDGRNGFPVPFIYNSLSVRLACAPKWVSIATQWIYLFYAVCAAQNGTNNVCPRCRLWTERGFLICFCLASGMRKHNVIAQASWLSGSLYKSKCNIYSMTV